MTKDFAVKNNTSFRAYAGLQAGTVMPASGNSIATNGAILGARVEKNGTYLNAEVGAGTAFTGKIEAGRVLPIGRNIGLDLSANVYGAKSTSKNTIFMNAGPSINEINVQTPAGDVVSINSQSLGAQASWKPTSLSAGAKAQLNFKPTKRITFQAGVEGGIRHSVGTNMNLSAVNKNTADVTINGKTETYTNESVVKQSYNGRKTEGYITPIIAFKMDLGKNNQFGIFADASLRQRQIGVKYNF